MRDELIRILKGPIPVELVEALVEDFLTVRRDAATAHPGGAAPGRFVESFVQILQYLATGQYDTQPSVDRVLQSLESVVQVDEGLRICAARLARSIYTLRNKRGIAHKGAVNLNEYDLQYLCSATQWVWSS